jgi:hypothetical protein
MPNPGGQPAKSSAVAMLNHAVLYARFAPAYSLNISNAFLSMPFKGPHINKTPRECKSLKFSTWPFIRL